MKSTRADSANRYDVIVVGAGPGGSLTAMMLASRGRRVALIDRDTFPRFAIGESSTPIADRTLEQIAADYNLPELLPLARWGRWRRSLTNVTSGLKRGFTYFDHRGSSGTDFSSLMSDRDKRLLVAASPSDQEGDTHWLRSDVDQYLIEICRSKGVDVRLGCRLSRIEAGDPWRLRVLELGRDQKTETLLSKRIVDASGRAGAVVRAMGFRDTTASLRTNTSATFTHLVDAGIADQSLLSGVPYPPLAAAVHHLLRDGWVWQLPFDDGRVSVGRVWSRSPQSPVVREGTGAVIPPGNLAQNLGVTGYPLMESWLGGCSLAVTPGRWIESTRVQHRYQSSRPMSIAMLPLPTTLATIDPLHSTGLAHAITGAQRVSDLILRNAEGEVTRYADQVNAEIDLLDRVISLAYRVWQPTNLLFDASMLYFAIAIGDEERRVREGFLPARSTWGASDEAVQRVTEAVESMLVDALEAGTRVCQGALCGTLRSICDVPLACREANLYGYTFAESAGSTVNIQS